jgi:hypothetical protein
MSVKLPFARLNGKPVSILEVPNGKDCNCVCPGCGRPLIAKNNEENVREKHFSHMGHDNCGIDLRQLAANLLVEVLRDCPHIHLPKIVVERKFPQKPHPVADSATKRITSVSDPDFSRFHPKILIECEGTPLELFPYLSKAICGISDHSENPNPDHSALRVNMTSVFEEKDLERLKSIILHDAREKTWLRSLLREKWIREHPEPVPPPLPPVSTPRRTWNSPRAHSAPPRQREPDTSYTDSDPDWKKMEAWEKIPGMSPRFHEHLRRRKATESRFQKPREVPVEETYRCVICGNTGIHKFRMRPILKDDPQLGKNRGVCDGSVDGKTCYSEFVRRRSSELL